MYNKQVNKILTNIINSIETYSELSKYEIDNQIELNYNQRQAKENLLKDMLSSLQTLYSSGNFNEENIKQIIDRLKDKTIDISTLATILAGSISNTKLYASQGALQALNICESNFSNMIFGKINVNDIIDEIAQQKLTLIAYRTKYGYKTTLCSIEHIDETLSKILPTITHGDNIKINNCPYPAGGFGPFCEKYICSPDILSSSDITIIPAISHNSVSQYFTSTDAKQQYKNIYEKMFKFFNKKNVPISLLQTSACKGNNFAFALSDNINEDIKINTLEFSTLNVINGMLLPNYHSKYAETATQCFYKKNINHLRIHFNYTIPEALFLHALPGAIGYAEETIAKILEQANDVDKKEKISVLKKILDSFDNTINVVLQKKNDNLKENCFAKNFCKSVDSTFFRKKFTVNNKQFLEQLKGIQQNINDIQNVDKNFQKWISTSIDEFEKQIDGEKTLKQILENNKFYDETTMSPTLAGLEVLEENKKKIQEFMVKNNITVEDLGQEQNQQNKQEKQNDKQTEKDNNIAKNPISSLDNILMQISDMQKNENYKKDETSSNNLQSDISLQTLHDLQTQR